jgi:eukaryotic-like serine/threonine-protein kinase
MALHRRLPGKRSILRRLIAGKAAAFLRAYQKVAPDDPWAASKPSSSARSGSHDVISYARQ